MTFVWQGLGFSTGAARDPAGKPNRTVMDPLWGMGLTPSLSSLGPFISRQSGLVCGRCSSPAGGTVPAGTTGEFPEQGHRALSSKMMGWTNDRKGRIGSIDLNLEGLRRPSPPFLLSMSSTLTQQQQLGAEW